MNLHRHMICGGNLTFHHKEGMKTLYICDKCGELVNCVVNPSYNRYVLSGRIEVPQWRYRQIRKEEGLE